MTGRDQRQAQAKECRQPPEDIVGKKGSPREALEGGQPADPDFSVCSPVLHSVVFSPWKLLQHLRAPYNSEIPGAALTS